MKMFHEAIFSGTDKGILAMRRGAFEFEGGAMLRAEPFFVGEAFDVIGGLKGVGLSGVDAVEVWERLRLSELVLFELDVVVFIHVMVRLTCHHILVD